MCVCVCVFFFYCSVLVCREEATEVHRLMRRDDICSAGVPALLWPIVINHGH